MNPRKFFETVSCRPVLESLETRRLMAFGQVDVDFGTGGTALLPVSGASTTVVVDELGVLSSGKIVAFGAAAIARFNTDGSVDNAFGTNGRTLLPASTTYRAGVVDTSNNASFVLVSGTAGSLVLRYTASGKLDTTFGTGGTALVSSSSNFNPQTIAVQADGKILVGGTIKTDGGNGARARVYRLNANGGGDTGFGTGATVDVQLGTTNLLTPVLRDEVTGIAVLSSGKFLVGGGSLAYSPDQYDPNTGDFTPAEYGDSMFAVARINSNGTLDTTYGGAAPTGVSRATYQTGVFGEQPSAVALKSDGSIGLAVRAQDGLTVAQFSPTGTVDFNKIVEPGFEFDGTPVDMAAKADGRYFIIGPSFNRGHGEQVVQVDNAGLFSNVVYTDDLDGNTVDLATTSNAAIVIAGDGDLIVGGEPGDFSAAFALMKLDDGVAGTARPDEFANGQNNDIARDSEGGLHIAYFDASTKTLKYAYRAPTGLWNAPVTVDATLNAGFYLSIDTDSQNRPGIVYFDGTNGDARYAFKATTTFSTEPIETKGSTGLYPSLVFDNTDRPTTTFYVKGTASKKVGDLRFAVKDLGIWKFETVQSANDVGRSGDLDVDPVTGRFAVAYVDTTVGQVNYALHQKGGKWAISGAASTQGGADYLSLDYTFFGQRPSISYYDAFAADLKITSFSGTSWTERLLASKNAVGQYNHLEYDSSGGAVYAYNRTSDSIFLLREQFNPNALSETIVSGGGKYLSVDSNGNIADGAYYDAVAQVLKVRSLPTHIAAES